MPSVCQTCVPPLICSLPSLGPALLPCHCLPADIPRVTVFLWDQVPTGCASLGIFQKGGCQTELSAGAARKGVMNAVISSLFQGQLRNPGRESD